MKKRILQLFGVLGLTQADFCRECGIKDATLSAMGDYLSTQNVIRIASRYPELNLRWLLLGEGPIWLDNRHETQVKEEIPQSLHTPLDSSEIAFLRDMVSKQHETIQILIRNIEKNYPAREGAAL